MRHIALAVSVRAARVFVATGGGEQMFEPVPGMQFVDEDLCRVLCPGRLDREHLLRRHRATEQQRSMLDGLSLHLVCRAGTTQTGSPFRHQPERNGDEIRMRFLLVLLRSGRGGRFIEQNGQLLRRQVLPDNGSPHAVFDSLRSYAS